MNYIKLAIILMGIFPFNLHAQKDDSTKNTDSEIYKVVLDSLPSWDDFKVIGMPRAHTRYSDSIYNLLEKDSLYFLSVEVRKNLFSEQSQQKLVSFKNCDTCRFVGYFYERTFRVNPTDSFVRNCKIIPEGIKWFNNGDSLIYLNDFSIGNITFVNLTANREKQNHPPSVHPMINGIPLYLQFGQYYIGWIMMSNIIYSDDRKNAFLLLVYNQNITAEILLHYNDQAWTIERKLIKEICCW